MVHLIDTNRLLPHEEVEPARIAKLSKEIKRKGITKPILVEAENLVILDGHHRYRVAQALGYTEIPALLVDYDDVEFSLWRDDVYCTKQDVIRNAQEGILFPSKTTRHTLKSSNV